MDVAQPEAGLRSGIALVGCEADGAVASSGSPRYGTSLPLLVAIVLRLWDFVSLPASSSMGNGDARKAAKTGGEQKFRDKARCIHIAGHKVHTEAKAEKERLSHLRRFEDAGLGYAKVTATGRQYEHEERMREQKAKREAKAVKAAQFLASVQHAALGDDAGEEEAADEAGASPAQPRGADAPPQAPRADQLSAPAR